MSLAPPPLQRPCPPDFRGHKKAQEARKKKKESFCASCAFCGCVFSLCLSVRQTRGGVVHRESGVGPCTCELITLRISAGGNGFCSPPIAPSFRASSQTCGVPCAVTRRMGICG